LQDSAHPKEAANRGRGSVPFETLRAQTGNLQATRGIIRLRERKKEKSKGSTQNAASPREGGSRPKVVSP